MKMRGEYVIYPGTEKEIVVPNKIIGNGQVRILQAFLQNNPVTTFLIGLMNEVPAYDAVIADLTTEPTAAGGYARQSLTASIANWPITQASGRAYGESATVTFTATGVDFSGSISRLFLMESAGELFSYSAALQQPLLITAGTSFPVKYRLYFE